MRIDDRSHLDHGLTPAQVEWLKEVIAPLGPEFTIKVFVLPDHFDSVPCALYGPEMGDNPISEDQVYYKVRGDRKCASRIILDKEPRQVWSVVVIGADVLYTAYGGYFAAPREPGDLSLSTWDEVQEARAFWATHALAEE